MGSAVVDTLPGIAEAGSRRRTAPLPGDSRLRRRRPGEHGEVFVAADRPYGLIECTVLRDSPHDRQPRAVRRASVPRWPTTCWPASRTPTGMPLARAERRPVRSPTRSSTSAVGHRGSASGRLPVPEGQAGVDPRREKPQHGGGGNAAYERGSGGCSDRAGGATSRRSSPSSTAGSQRRRERARGDGRQLSRSRCCAWRRCLMATCPPMSRHRGGDRNRGRRPPGVPRRRRARPVPHRDDGRSAHSAASSARGVTCCASTPAPPQRLLPGSSSSSRSPTTATPRAPALSPYGYSTYRGS